jgi:hypothetical protein
VSALRDKFVEIACRGVWSGRSVGWWLRRNKDRVVSGRSFRSEQGRNGQQWRLATQNMAQQASLRDVGDR